MTPTIRRRYRLAIACLTTYALLLLAGTHWPKEFLPGREHIAASDKRIHMFAYAVLGGLMMGMIECRALALGRDETPPAVRWIIAVGACIVFGFLDEATQPLFGRYFEWADWLADSAGAVIGATIVALALRTGWFRQRMLGEVAASGVGR